MAALKYFQSPVKKSVRYNEVFVILEVSYHSQTMKLSTEKETYNQTEYVAGLVSS